MGSVPVCNTPKWGLTIALYNGMIKVLFIDVMFLLILAPIFGCPKFEAAIPHWSKTVMSALTVCNSQILFFYTYA